MDRQIGEIDTDQSKTFADKGDKFEKAKKEYN